MRSLDGLLRPVKEVVKDVFAIIRRTPVLLTFPLITAFASINDSKSETNQPQKIEQTAKNYGLNWANLKDVNKDGIVDESDYFDMKVDDFEQYLQKTMIRPGSPDSPPPEINQGDMINPYKEPNDRELKYGRGDVNKDGKRDSLDYQLMVAGDESDASDVNMDGIKGDAEDLSIFSEFVSGQRDYLPAEYNKLQTPDERKQWYDRALLLDGIDGTIISWHDGTPDERFISGNYSYATYKAIYGFMKWDSTHDDEHIKYAFIENGKFNGPMYMAVLSDTLGMGHGVNAGWIGDIDSLGNFIDDTRDIKNWLCVEPYTNETIKGKDWEFPPNRGFRIYAAQRFIQGGSSDMPYPYNAIKFESDSTGNLSVTYENLDLIKQRPDWISTLPDALPPEITITNPKQDSTYTSHVTGLEYIVSDVHPDSMWYSTDGQPKIYIPWDSEITDLRSNQGENTWILYAKDWVGHASSDTTTFNVDTTINAITEDPTVPSEYSLNQNYPNPFNSSTTIGYSIPEGGPVSLIIYNLVGKELETLVNQEQSPGEYKVNFNASRYSSGIYFYRLEAGDYTEIEKMALIK